MPEPRQYLVGLPAVATVHDDGTVTYWLDTSETDTAMFENIDDDSDLDEATLLADQKRIQDDHARRFEEKRQTL